MTRRHALEQRGAATGEQAERVREAQLRLEAVATNLAAVALGHLAAEDAVAGCLRLVDVALDEIGRASE
jgi:hypothetical protein